MKFRIHLAAAVVAAGLPFGLSSCAKTVPMTPIERVQLATAQTLGALAESNKVATRLAIDLNGVHILSDDKTRLILAYTDAIAKAVTAAFAVQDSQQTDEQKAAAILVAFRAISLSPDLASFVNAPNANKDIAALISALRTIIDSVRARVGAPGIPGDAGAAGTSWTTGDVWDGRLIRGSTATHYHHRH